MTRRRQHDGPAALRQRVPLESDWKACEENLGIPLPAATQCEIMTETAVPLQPALEELKRQAAQGEVVHNDDTSMRVLSLDRDADISPERTGVFTSGLVWIVARAPDCAVFHRVQARRRESGRGVETAVCRTCRPSFKCAMPFRATCRRSVETLVANCNAHGRRNFVKVTANFPEPCRFVLETFGRGLRL